MKWNEKKLRSNRRRSGLTSTVASSRCLNFANRREMESSVHVDFNAIAAGAVLLKQIAQAYWVVVYQRRQFRAASLVRLRQVATFLHICQAVGHRQQFGHAISRRRWSWARCLCRHADTDHHQQHGHNHTGFDHVRSRLVAS